VSAVSPEGPGVLETTAKEGVSFHIHPPMSDASIADPMNVYFAKYSPLSIFMAGRSAGRKVGVIGKGIDGAHSEVAAGEIVGVNQGSHTSSSECGSA